MTAPVCPCDACGPEKMNVCYHNNTPCGELESWRIDYQIEILEKRLSELKKLQEKRRQ